MFKRVEFGGLSGTSFEDSLETTTQEMLDHFGEPDRYQGDSKENYNWEFRSESNENAIYNVYTTDGGKNMSLGHNGLGESSDEFKNWLYK